MYRPFGASDADDITPNITTGVAFYNVFNASVSGQLGTSLDALMTAVGGSIDGLLLRENTPFTLSNGTNLDVHAYVKAA